MKPDTLEFDPDTLRLLEAGDCGTLATDVATCRQLLAEQSLKAADQINVLLAGRDRLKAINAELVEALEWITQFCAEHPDWFGVNNRAKHKWWHDARHVLVKARKEG